MKEIFPSLFLVLPHLTEEPVRFTYLLKRPQGNILLATKADISDEVTQIVAAGGVAHVLLGDRHHADGRTEALANRLGSGLSCSKIESLALKKKGVTVKFPLPFQASRLDDDLEIIPTPGHTPGAFSYLWTCQGRRFLFVGDTIVPINGAWRYWVTSSNRATFGNSLRTLAALSFDVILSNSFAANPVAWFEIDSLKRASIFEELRHSLATV